MKLLLSVGDRLLEPHRLAVIVTVARGYTWRTRWLKDVAYPGVNMA